MKTYRDPKTLRDAIRSFPNGVIAIDGVDGSGKSTLANALLVDTPDWAVLHLDDYLHKENGTYVENIDTVRLNEDLRKSVGYVIVEGVCVLHVLKRINKTPACHIYVKQFNRHGLWMHEGESCFDCSAEEKIKELSARAAMISRFSEIDRGVQPDGDSDTVGLTEFRSEVIRYHAETRPFERANVIYERVENETRPENTGTPQANAPLTSNSPMDRISIRP